MIIYTIIFTYLKKQELSTKWPLWCRFINRKILDKIIKYDTLNYGFRMYCGKQGSGKTYSAVKKALDLTKENTNLISNLQLNVPYNYIYIKTIDELEYCLSPDKQNIVVLDEIQTMLDSRNFNADFYKLFCQLRKRNVLILGTAQVFERVAKPLREQCNRLFFCKTFSGCLTVVREVAVLLNSSCELCSPLTDLGVNYYVQSDKYRSAYSTTQII